MKAFKFTALLFAVVFALCACSCSPQTTPTPTPGGSTVPSVTPGATVTPNPTSSMSPSMTPSTSPESSPESSPGAGGGTSNKMSFTPGKYRGEGEGMNGKVVVEVEFAADKIVSVSLVEHNETAGIYEKAADTLTLEIVEGQTLNVEAVTGATYTSNAILQAVEDCVVQAGGDIGMLKSSKTR